jgi:hypothetical protein
MAIQLVSQAGEVTLSNADWYKAVQLACHHGFQPPKGYRTLLPRDPSSSPPVLLLRFTLP